MKFCKDFFVWAADSRTFMGFGLGMATHAVVITLVLFL